MPFGQQQPVITRMFGSRMNTGNAYLLHPYRRFSNRKSGLKRSVNTELQYWTLNQTLDSHHWVADTQPKLTLSETLR
jgi:hypothetical protein